eukprot:CAMPEP_0185210402 /NCGR_PEP_ID=MMETSP1140-20130426/65557_1 /TAXON_ID=298111 /ORGANISM="Pavlova sp., Strain CCMP459" /LENGTH=51 /DNA_ID=CAMNT_0027778209 /DNA_START=479 /DNA_END=634 /DNA_ORIENTATION=+
MSEKVSSTRASTQYRTTAASVPSARTSNVEKYLPVVLSSMPTTSPLSFASM